MTRKNDLSIPFTLIHVQNGVIDSQHSAKNNSDYYAGKRPFFGQVPQSYVQDTEVFLGYAILELLTLPMVTLSNVIINKNYFWYPDAN